MPLHQSSSVLSLSYSSQLLPLRSSILLNHLPVKAGCGCLVDGIDLNYNYDEILTLFTNIQNFYGYIHIHNLICSFATD